MFLVIIQLSLIICLLGDVPQYIQQKMFKIHDLVMK